MSKHEQSECDRLRAVAVRTIENLERVIAELRLDLTEAWGGISEDERENLAIAERLIRDPLETEKDKQDALQQTRELFQCFPELQWPEERLCDALYAGFTEYHQLLKREILDAGKQLGPSRQGRGGINCPMGELPLTAKQLLQAQEERQQHIKESELKQERQRQVVELRRHRGKTSDEYMDYKRNDAKTRRQRLDGPLAGEQDESNDLGIHSSNLQIYTELTPHQITILEDAYEAGGIPLADVGETEQADFDLLKLQGLLRIISVNCYPRRQKAYVLTRKLLLRYQKSVAVFQQCQDDAIHERRQHLAEIGRRLTQLLHDLGPKPFVMTSRLAEMIAVGGKDMHDAHSEINQARDWDHRRQSQLMSQLHKDTIVIQRLCVLARPFHAPLVVAPDVLRAAMSLHESLATVQLFNRAANAGHSAVKLQLFYEICDKLTEILIAPLLQQGEQPHGAPILDHCPWTLPLKPSPYVHRKHTEQALPTLTDVSAIEVRLLYELQQYPEGITMMDVVRNRIPLTMLASELRHFTEIGLVTLDRQGNRFYLSEQGSQVIEELCGRCKGTGSAMPSDEQRQQYNSFLNARLSSCAWARQVQRNGQPTAQAYVDTPEWLEYLGIKARIEKEDLRATMLAQSRTEQWDHETWTERWTHACVERLRAFCKKHILARQLIEWVKPHVALYNWSRSRRSDLVLDATCNEASWLNHPTVPEAILAWVDEMPFDWSQTVPPTGRRLGLRKPRQGTASAHKQSNVFERILQVSLQNAHELELPDAQLDPATWFALNPNPIDRVRVQMSARNRAKNANENDGKEHQSRA